MSDIVMHWEDLRNKIVTAMDKRVGKIVDISDDYFVILNATRMTYSVPKSHVDQYNGY
jgi:rRNA processing protein Gar1